ncbi:arsenic metallochaperone ArsD family protein [Ectothiorhodospira sp. 9100]
MTEVAVFDPPHCCASGLCGSSVESWSETCD